MDSADLLQLPTVLLPGLAGAIAISADGEYEELDRSAALQRWEAGPLLLCHRGNVARRLSVNANPGMHHLDILELFAFVYPARFVLPTPAGIAAALGLPVPDDQIGLALSLFSAAERMLDGLLDPGYPDREETAQAAQQMLRAGWSWGALVAGRLGSPVSAAGPLGGLDIWRHLAEWEEFAPPPPAGDRPVSATAAREKLRQMLGEAAEQREKQADFAALAAESFAPLEQAGHPHVILAEAGTGIGKTAAYLAPAEIWARQNDGCVWVSTYTKNLQRQIDSETDRLYADPAEKSAKVAIRKGRENYLCLLNLQETMIGGRPANPAGPGLIARWARYCRDGDLSGGDFPAWLGGLLGANFVSGLSDHRGECIYSACTHYRKCFIEKAIRKARQAEIVIANHALVMIHAALAQPQPQIPELSSEPSRTALQSTDRAEGQRLTPAAPSRYIFDEGHHLFQAADSAFSAHLSVFECAELRRWIRGAEAQRSGRARGLTERVGDLVSEEEEDGRALIAARRAAAILPAPGWRERLHAGRPQGVAEEFFSALRQLVLARAADPRSGFDLEAELVELPDPLLDAADAFARGLARIGEPLKRLSNALASRLDNETSQLDSASRNRIDAVCRSLRRRALVLLPSWEQILRDLHRETPAEFVDWAGLERIAGRDNDVGIRRHWVDPTLPFASALLSGADGVLITSATLQDKAGDLPDDWTDAEIRTGVQHLPLPTRRARFESPFDYAAQSRVFIVSDLAKNDVAQTAAAYRELFLAAGGGGLGIFTAIHRLRAVYSRIAFPLAEQDIALYAQHVDGMDVGTLVDIFRADMTSCLLGTDAVRDGVDVPGSALRLIVFDRVPWPRPDILHRARRNAFGGRHYDEFLTRMKLKQAFGRLLRKQDDKGVFVILDRQMPTRLTSCFPSDITVERCGIAETIGAVRAFLGD